MTENGTYRTRALIAAAVIVAAVAGFAIGAIGQYRAERELDVMRHDAAQTRTVEAKITEWIVKRNPSATILDFADFPAALLAESRAADIDFRLVIALIDKESEFNPRAVGRAGEVGLMQVLPSTAAIIAKNKQWEYSPPTRGASGYAALGTLGQPRDNIRFGLAYLKDQVNRFGVSPAAFRAYNRGTDRALEARPSDRYAEDIGLRLIALTRELP